MVSTARAAVSRASVRAGGAAFSIRTTRGSTNWGASSRLLAETWKGALTAPTLRGTAAGGAVVFGDHDPRRLAGAPDATYLVVDGALKPAAAQVTSPVGPHTVVTVRGPAGGRLPADATRTAVFAEEPAPGTYRLTVPASHSDVVLRALLTAHPPWHVVTVSPSDVPPDEKASP
jgi:hypothetical protein